MLSDPPGAELSSCRLGFVVPLKGDRAPEAFADRVIGRRHRPQVQRGSGGPRRGGAVAL